MEQKMKTLRSVLSLACFALTVSLAAQPSPRPAAHPLEQPFETGEERTEIFLPKVNGMNFYKADLHLHTIFSDGDVTPDMRVVEAWCTGLDAIAITDHVEYRRIEREMFKFMDQYIREDLRRKGEALNTNITKKDADGYGILVDLNVGYNAAVKKAKDYGILVIRGVEITRRNNNHFNALFTKDNNRIYDPDLTQAVRNARAQGAFILHNHPAYGDETPNHFSELAAGLYAQGLIDGVEVANGQRTWWHLFTHAVSGGFTPFADSDAHEYIYWRYGRPGDYEVPRYRNMNLILAKALTENDLQEALKAGNNIAYSNNNLVGKRELLQALFAASVECRPAQTDAAAPRRRAMLVNHSSLPYYFRIGEKEYLLNAMSSLTLPVQKEETGVTVTVLNMWCGNDEHPAVTFTLK